MNGCSLEYISSGMSFTRIVFKEAREEKEVNDYIVNSFSELNKCGENHAFSILCNAWTEASFGKQFQHFRPGIKEIMMDSGGLQIITQGKTITDEVKKQVYKTQGEWADTGLSFDEIPLEINGESSSRLDLSNRRFDDSIFEKCAVQTGINLRDQIETFLEMGTKCQPIFITQGNCYDTYMKWTEIALEQLPAGYEDHIGGVAMGAAALGNGTLEDIKRAFYFTQLPIETKRLHVLGVGSIARMAPYLVFMQNGLYKDIHVSYDSTTHTSGIEMGRFYDVKRCITFPRKFDPKIHKLMFDSIQNSPYKIDGLTLDLFHEAMNCASLKFKEKYGSRNLFIMVCVGLACASISNFIRHVERSLVDKKGVLSVFKKPGEMNNIASLYGIKTLEDFEKWDRDIGSRFVKTLAVSSKKKEQTELEDLF
jgi:hypothetical protein